MRVAFVVAAALAAICLGPAQAFADTPDGARQRLIAAQLLPNPIYPASLPPAWQDARADLSHHGQLFEVDYSKCCDPAGANTFLVSFGRWPYDKLRDYLRYVHQVRHSYRVLRIGSRRVYLTHDDIHDAYMWHEQHFTYFLSRHDGVINRPSLQLLARVVASFSLLPNAENHTQQRLAALKLSPNPVFPTYLPAAWQTSNARLAHTGSLFDIEYIDCCDPQGYLTLIVDFGRVRYGALREYLRYVHDIGHHYRALQIGSRRVYAVHDDIYDGYMWHEQHFTYLLSAHGALEETPSMHVMASVVASLAPLPPGS